MCTHTSAHLNFSQPEIKFTGVNFIYIISIHSENRKTQNLLSSKEEAAHRRGTQVSIDDDTWKKKSNTLKWTTCQQ